MNIKVLRMVNSAAFGLVKKVSGLQHAVTILGRSRLESLLLTYAVTTSVPPSLKCIDTSRFWLASAKRACLAKHIAHRLHPATQAESFTAALLQDMAIPLISESKGELYKNILDQWHAEQDAEIDAIEREALDYDHPTIGALMAEEWELPEYLVNAIAGHHDLSEDSSAEPAVRLVSLIRYSDDEGDRVRLLGKAEEDFGIGANMMEEMIVKAFEEADQFAHTFQ
jgi:HD-like signal output (HDOD) protein